LGPDPDNTPEKAKMMTEKKKNAKRNASGFHKLNCAKQKITDIVCQAPRGIVHHTKHKRDGCVEKG